MCATFTASPNARYVPAANAGRIVFLGDSLTYDWSTAGRAVWQARYEPLGAVNCGVPGDTTADVLARIAGVFDGLVPALVVLLIGTNDLGTGSGPQQTVDGIRACLDAVRARVPASRVLLLALLPRGDGGPGGERFVAMVNTRIEKLADETTRFANLAPAFSDAKGTLHAGLYEADELHLSTAGYKAWADALDGPLRAALVG